MAEIEDMARPSVRRAQNLLHPQLDNFKRRKQRDGVEVSLHRVAMAHRAPALVERLPPVEPNHIRARRSHLRQQPAVSTPK